MNKSYDSILKSIYDEFITWILEDKIEHLIMMHYDEINRVIKYVERHYDIDYQN